MRVMLTDGEVLVLITAVVSLAILSSVKKEMSEEEEVRFRLGKVIDLVQMVKIFLFLVTLCKVLEIGSWGSNHC